MPVLMACVGLVIVFLPLFHESMSLLWPHLFHLCDFLSVLLLCAFTQFPVLCPVKIFLEATLSETCQPHTVDSECRAKNMERKMSSLLTPFVALPQFLVVVVRIWGTGMCAILHSLFCTQQCGINPARFSEPSWEWIETRISFGFCLAQELVCCFPGGCMVSAPHPG